MAMVPRSKPSPPRIVRRSPEAAWSGAAAMASHVHLVVDYHPSPTYLIRRCYCTHFVAGGLWGCCLVCYSAHRWPPRLGLLLVPMYGAVAYLQIDSENAPLVFQTADREGVRSHL